MEELSIEQKAQRYDEAIEQLRAMMPNWENLSYNGKTFLQDLVHIIPELKESGDIRKRIIDSLHGDVLEMGEIKKAIAWLEKQGNLMKALQISNARIGELIEKNYYLKEQLEKQGEHANFLSKIQVGDKVTRNEDGVLVNISQLNRVAKKRKNQGNNMGISEATKKKLEDNLNKALEKETPESWNEFLDEQGEQPKKHDVCDNCDQQGSCVSPCPMKLVEKQGEQKPVFEMKTPEESLGVDSDTYNKIVDECVYGEPKPAWSEEDIELLDNTIKFIEDRVAATSPSLRTYSPTLTGKEIPFLKALKERYTWKPSKREKEALLWCVVHLGGADKQTLGELLEALNKL